MSDEREKIVEFIRFHAARLQQVEAVVEDPFMSKLVKSVTRRFGRTLNELAEGIRQGEHLKDF